MPCLFGKENSESAQINLAFPEPSQSVFEPHSLSCVESLTFIRDGINYHPKLLWLAVRACQCTGFHCRGNRAFVLFSSSER